MAATPGLDDVNAHMQSRHKCTAECKQIPCFCLDHSLFVFCCPKNHHGIEKCGNLITRDRAAKFLQSNKMVAEKEESRLKLLRARIKHEITDAEDMMKIKETVPEAHLIGDDKKMMLQFDSRRVEIAKFDLYQLNQFHDFICKVEEHIKGGHKMRSSTEKLSAQPKGRRPSSAHGTPVKRGDSNQATAQATAAASPRRANCKNCKCLKNEPITNQSGKTFKPRFTTDGHETCAAQNTVYAVGCSKCPGLLYIGESGERFCERMRDHRNQKNEPVGEHFSQNGHEIETRVISDCFIENAVIRRDLKRRLMEEMDTVEQGFNKSSPEKENCIEMRANLRKQLGVWIDRYLHSEHHMENLGKVLRLWKNNDPLVLLNPFPEYRGQKIEKALDSFQKQKISMRPSELPKVVPSTSPEAPVAADKPDGGGLDEKIERLVEMKTRELALYISRLNKKVVKLEDDVNELRQKGEQTAEVFVRRTCREDEPVRVGEIVPYNGQDENAPGAGSDHDGDEIDYGEMKRSTSSRRSTFTFEDDSES